MNESEVKDYLSIKLKFSDVALQKLQILENELLLFNKKYNLISKSTESIVWHRHILDSAQLVDYINFEDGKSLSDLGSGAGFPGIVIAIFNDNPKFHVKLFEKSNIKANFLEKIAKITKSKLEVYRGSYINHNIDSDYILARAFKKLPEILRISRETVKIPHRLIVMKGKNAQTEINNALKIKLFEYKLVQSITDTESKIILVDDKKK